MKKCLLILFCSTLFAQNNLTGSIKLSKSEFSEDAKNSFNIDVMYNHYISNSTFLGIGYTQESLVFENLTTSLFDEDFDDIVSYHGLRVELNQELIKILDKEQELVTEELKNSGKPDDIAKKISLGKMNKFKEENALLTQAWVMEPKKKVKDVLKELSIADLKIKEFYRIKIGE